MKKPVFPADGLNILDFSRAHPHVGQQGVLESVANFKVTVLSPGRQWGKSSVRNWMIPNRIASTAGFAVGAYMGPAHSDAKKAYEEDLVNLGGAGLVVDKGGDDQDRHIDYRPIHTGFPVIGSDGRPHPDRCECWDCRMVRYALRDLKGGKNAGGRVYYVSGGPDVHRQFQKHKLNFAFPDEMSHIAPDAWWETLRPMFNTTGGHTLMVGTPIPEGINFAGFSDLYDMGDPKNPERKATWNSIRGSSFENPYSNRDEIAEQIADLEKAGRGALVRCLYYGEFVTDLGAVFQNLDAVFSLECKEVDRNLWIGRPAAEGELVVVSIDFGRHDDSTVVMAWSRDTLEQLALLRIQNTEYLVQMPLIDRFVRRYPRRMIWSEGREEMAGDTLRLMYGDNVSLVKWTGLGAASKNGAVARGMDLFDRAAWKMLKIPWVKEEFRLFARTKTIHGNWQYNAPDGKHDDAVSCALYATQGLPIEANKKPVSGKPGAPMSPHIFRKPKAAEDSRTHPFLLRRG